MREGPRTFAEHLTRSLAASGLLYALVLAYAVPTTLLAGHAADEARGRDADRLDHAFDHSAWTPAVAKKFPRCIDMADWSGDGPPAAVIVRRHDGRLGQMSFDEAVHRATSSSSADDVWVIGACA